MKQKDYKAIAKIIKDTFGTSLLSVFKNHLVKKFANYFEKEDIHTIDICNCGCEEKEMEGAPTSGTYFVCAKCKLNCDTWTKTRTERFGAFNRKPFYEWAGVEE